MSLWRQTPDLEQLNASQKNSIGDLLGIRFEAVDDESLTASMPVDSRTHQPFGLLHGGASVVLAESLGSMASYLCVELADEDHRRLGMLQHLARRLGGEIGIEGDGNVPGHPDRQVSDDPVRTVLRDDRDTAA